jgi:hypothetical protein
MMPKMQKEDEHETNLFNYLLWWLMFDTKNGLDNKRYKQAKKELSTDLYTPKMIEDMEIRVLNSGRFNMFLRTLDSDIVYIRDNIGFAKRKERK